MRIGMLGGTYDPIHNGHLMLGKKFASLLELDKILIIPTGTPPHKKASQTPARRRLKMCRLAAKDLGELYEASDIEIVRKGKSYSYLTLCELHEKYPGSEFFLIMGADMFMTLETWYRFDDLKELATFCTVARNDISTQELEEYAKKLESLGCRCCVTDVEQVDISSTMIREKISNGEPITGFVPESVEKYILKKRLYRKTGSK